MRSREFVLLFLVALTVSPLVAQSAPSAMSAAAPYKVGVVSESGDIVSWFIPDGPRLIPDRVVPVGINPMDPDGPHNLAVSPDNRWYFISIAHGLPNGSLWRLDAVNDTVAGRAPLGLYPTTIGLTPDGEWALVANSDFHGEAGAIDPVSLVHVPTMTSITDVTACHMPHGSKSNRAGTAIYVTCMHSDEILEFSTSTLGITRRGMAGPGMPGMGAGGQGQGAHADHGAPAGAAGAPVGAAGAPVGAAGAPVGAAGAPAADSSCQPTYVAVSTDDRSLYVACTHSNEMVVMDIATLSIQRRVPVGAGAYNVEVAPNGSVIVVTNKKAQSVSLIDPRSLTEVARIPTTKRIVHGVAFSPDSRYAYISQESIGADPGAIDVIDLSTRQKVFSVPVRAQPTGIAVWRRPN